MSTNNQPRTLRVTTPADHAVALAVMIGHVPTESVIVALTWVEAHAGGPGAFRLDLSPVPGELATALARILADLSAAYGPLASIGACLYATDPRAARLDLLTALQTATETHTVGRVDVVTAYDGDAAWLIDISTTGSTAGVRHPVDLTAHPFIAELVGDGRTMETAEDLAKVVEPASAAEVATLAQITEQAGVAAADPWAALADLQQVAGPDASPGVPMRLVALIAAATAHPGARDLIAADITRESARGDYRRLAWIATRTPESHAAPVLTLAAYAAWLAGDGMRARHALERALAAQPGYTLAVLLTRTLAAALPPVPIMAGADRAEVVTEAVAQVSPTQA